MKVRGLSAIVTTIVLAVILYLGSRYINSTKIDHSNDTKNHLTHNLTQKNLAKPTPRVAGLQINEKKDNLNKSVNQSEVKDGNESLLAIGPSQTEVEINNMTQSQFTVLLKSTELKLPTIADIKKLPSEAVHHTPAIIMQAGRDLGYIKEILKVHPSYEIEANVFYEKCAKTKEFPKSVKALCLTNLIEIKKKNGEILNLNNYPNDIVELSKLIIDI